MQIRLLLSFFLVVGCGPLFAAEYYLDSQNGSDSRSGTTPETAWRSLEKLNAAELKPGDTVFLFRTGVWRGTLRPKSGTVEAPITYTAFPKSSEPANAAAPKPRLYNSVPLGREEDWLAADDGLWVSASPVSQVGPATLPDVGNLIFDGNKAGFKKWKKSDLCNDDDFWFEPASRKVWIRSPENPAKRYSSIEAALRVNHIVDLSGAQHCVFSDLDLRYGAAHGFGGSSTAHITIRRCDLSWIGGGHQMSRDDGVPVRFGNAIEFWNDAHDHLIEECRLWEIYDAALTNQGMGKNRQENITYRNNVIWNCEYSFEYWNRDSESITKNIHVTGNACFDAGYGWGHRQRPDPNGRHLMFYETTAKTSEFFITDNIFSDATDSIARFDNRRGQEQTQQDSDAAQEQGGAAALDWTAELTLDRNRWYQPPGKTLVLWQKKVYTTEQFREYQKETGLDAHSTFEKEKIERCFRPLYSSRFRIPVFNAAAAQRGRDLTGGEAYRPYRLRYIGMCGRLRPQPSF